jgi:hypothetical protein
VVESVEFGDDGALLRTTSGGGEVRKWVLPNGLPPRTPVDWRCKDAEVSFSRLGEQTEFAWFPARGNVYVHPTANVFVIAEGSTLHVLALEAGNMEALDG